MFFTVRQFSAAGGTPVTWDPAHKTTNMSLANGNRDAIDVGNGTYEGVRSTTSQADSTGRYYWEMELIATRVADDMYIGLCNAIATLSGVTANYHFLWRGGGTIFASGTVYLAPPHVYAVGDILMFFYDTGTGNIWIGKNGTWLGSGADPATLTNPAAHSPSSAGVSFLAHITDNCPTDTYNFRMRGDTSQVNYTIPSNGVAWGA